MKIGIFPLIMAMSTIILGCSGEPVTRREIIGQWRIDDTTRNDLPEDFRSINISLALTADSLFVVENLPGSILFGLPRQSTLLIGGRGIWSLGDAADGQVLLLEFQEFQPEGVKGTPYTLNRIRVSRKDNQPQLYFYPKGQDVAARVWLLRQ